MRERAGRDQHEGDQHGDDGCARPTTGRRHECERESKSGCGCGREADDLAALGRGGDGRRRIGNLQGDRQHIDIAIDRYGEDQVVLAGLLEPRRRDAEHVAVRAGGGDGAGGCLDFDLCPPNRLVAVETVEIDGDRVTLGDGHELERIGLRFAPSRHAGGSRRRLVLMAFVGRHPAGCQKQEGDRHANGE